ncbi:hypothetical protein PENSPDRAFT_683498 [Peniophora sp. CONT]|nr:hypothetical protein PENSPDRAFT_683498 [Peniophora sp. CONT]
MSSSRSFTVFVDQPARAALKLNEPLATLSTTTTTAADALKENLHPVTGENPNAPSESAVKRRKSNVLSTKLYIPPTATKKGKAPVIDGSAQENNADEPRKRAAASSHDGKLLAKRPRRLVSAGRVRTLKDLPKVEEEPEPASSVLKATLAIEASPSKTAVETNDTALALDSLSRALDQVSLETALPVAAAQPGTSDPSNNAQASIGSQPETVLSDAAPRPNPKLVSDPQPVTPKTAVFTFPVSAKKVVKKTNKRKKGKAVVKKGDAAFSTPERKLIYSAFTFSTPSPSSQRFAVASRPAGMEAPRFGDSKLSFNF